MARYPPLLVVYLHWLWACISPFLIHSQPLVNIPICGCSPLCSLAPPRFCTRSLSWIPQGSLLVPWTLASTRQRGRWVHVRPDWPLRISLMLSTWSFSVLQVKWSKWGLYKFGLITFFLAVCAHVTHVLKLQKPWSHKGFPNGDYFKQF